MTERSWKTLLHVHTDYSFDSNITLSDLSTFLTANDFSCVSVTDHDTIEGALRMRRESDLNVIVGEEVTTREGHLIGLFLEEHIRPGMSARDTAKAIKEQGGVVLLPHPFVKAFGCGIGQRSWDIVHLVDAVEINNAQNMLPGADAKARAFAAATGLPVYVGADCHMKTSIAPCYQYLRPFTGPQDFLASLADAECVTGYHSWSTFIATGLRCVGHVAGLPLPEGYGVNATAHTNRESPAGMRPATA